MQKKNKNSLIVPVALGTLVVALMGTFMLSGTLAKFTSTSSAGSGNVPAAQFLFNTTYDEGTGKFIQNEWKLQSLGATVDDDYSEKVFYPGKSGDFKLDVDFISDVPAEATVEITPTLKGVYRDDVTCTYDGAETKVRDLAAVRFIVSTEEFGGAGSKEAIDFTSSEACNISQFPEKLKTALRDTIGENGIYIPGKDKDNTINKTVYVYWSWNYTTDDNGKTDEKDTLFGNYVSQLNNGSIKNVAGTEIQKEESGYGLNVNMTVTQIPVSEVNGTQESNTQGSGTQGSDNTTSGEDTQPSTEPSDDEQP